MTKNIDHARKVYGSGDNLKQRIEDWKTENGYSEVKAQEIIRKSMYDHEEYTPVGKER